MEGEENEIFESTSEYTSLRFMYFVDNCSEGSGRKQEAKSKILKEICIHMFAYVYMCVYALCVYVFEINVAYFTLWS